MSNHTPEVQPIIRTDSVSDVPVAHNERLLSGMTGSIIFLACVLFTSMHLYALNVSPIETWTFRILHVAGGLVVGFALTAAATLERETKAHQRSALEWLALIATKCLIQYFRVLSMQGSRARMEPWQEGALLLHFLTLNSRR